MLFKLLFSNNAHTIAFSVYILYLLNICQTQWITEEETCRTPENDFGRCIRVHECKPITDILTASATPVPPEVAAKIREYQCDVNSGTVKVCCPSRPIQIPNNNNNINNNNQEDFTRHRNYKLLPGNCGPLNDGGDKVINGENTTLYEFPWMALLSYRTKNGPDFRCGGAIINDRYILTAAHCIKNLKYPLIGVRVGEFNIPTSRDCETLQGGQVRCAPPVQDLSVEQIIPHPADPNDPYANDIGLVRVSRMNLTPQNVKPICLPFGDKQSMNIDGKLLIVTGWGATEKGISSPYLLKVEVPAISVQECARIYKNEVKITNKQICARGNNGKDACSGDSGGPMQLPLYHNGDVRYVIFGVVSFGTKRCDPNIRPGVYTRVGPFLKWILDNIRN